ncbi:hypothetical protein H671_5g14898 [Cricetulus griseus]|uniref:Uncharacterized protein n=1 Tax=Cricetulus griseus TaxID=10029 RepID=A0A061I078_CRIGR|nr:hypothetical protein H671_5g14898 [Cricetulus griseus]
MRRKAAAYGPHLHTPEKQKLLSKLIIERKQAVAVLALIGRYLEAAGVGDGLSNGFQTKVAFFFCTVL